MESVTVSGGYSGLGGTSSAEEVAASTGAKVAGGSLLRGAGDLGILFSISQALNSGENWLLGHPAGWPTPSGGTYQTAQEGALQKGFSSLGKWAQDAASYIANFEGNTDISILGWVGKTSSDFQSWTSNVADRFHNWGTDLESDYSTWSGNIAQLWHSWGSDLSSDYSSWSGQIEDKFHSWGQELSSDYDAWSGNIRDQWHSWGSTLDDNFQAWSEQIRSGWSSWGGSLRSEFSSWSSSIHSGWSNWGNSLRSDFSSWSSSIRSGWTSWGNELHSGATSFMSSIRSGWSSWWSSLNAELNTSSSQISANWRVWIGSLGNDLEQWWSSIKSFFGFGGNNIKGTQTSAQVSNWINTAMKDAGVSGSQWKNMLETLVMKESGGNPYAVDPTKVDGQNATGIAQMLPSTFAEYMKQGMSSITNPIDNLTAAIRYILATYHSPQGLISATGLGTGSYKGYASGGVIDEPIVGIGLSSGTHYMFGEEGSEAIIPLSGASGGGSSGMMPMRSGGGGNSAYFEVNISVPGLGAGTTQVRQLAEQMATYFKNEIKRRGNFDWG